MTEIVIVDDRVTNRNILQRLSTMLEPEAEIYCFAEPASAIERLTDHPVDLIITDFKMPGMNGGQFIQHCRTKIPDFDAPIIVVTAYEDREFRYDALEAGATEFLLSPIDHREFVTRVRNVLALHRQSKELRKRAVLLESELDMSWAQHAQMVESSEKRLRSVVDSNPNFIFTTSSSGKITVANAAFAAACGRTPEEMIDLPLRHVVSDNFFAERMLLGDEEVRQRRAPTRGEIKFVPTVGAEMYMHVSKTSFAGPNGKDYEVLTVLTDITQRRAAEEMLSAAKRAAEAANAAKSDFLANMSHELRTPLNAVIGFAELIKKDIEKLDNTVHQEYCDYIISGGQHLLAIISDVLDMAQIEAGKMHLNEESVSVDAMMAETSRLVQQTALRNNVRLIYSSPTNLPQIYVDASKFRQVLVNIADNALKFSHPNSEVYVGAELGEDGGMLISFTDSGVGMSESDLEIAFSRFGRVGPAFLSQPGTGLGLPLSVDLVRMHGGTLSINSQPGIGTKVVIILPPDRIMTENSSSDKSYARAAF